MTDEVLQSCLLEFQEMGVPDYVPRDLDVPHLKNMVTTIVGGRKVGKTYLTYQLIDRFLEQGLIPSLKHVCYLHFDDERLLEMQTEDLRRIDSVFLELSGASAQTPLLFVFDEIHRIKNWEYFALRLSRNRNWQVVVTGSSADLEEDKVGRQLRGKTYTIRLHPLSFREFLRFHGEEPSGKRFSTAAAARMRRRLQAYMKTGSYPAMRDIPEKDHREVLRQYFNSVVASDFVDTRRILHPLSCKIFLRNLLQRNGCPYTHKKERNTLASIGYGVRPDTISNWFNWAKESYFIGVNAIDSPSVKKQEQNYRKIYAVDWALANVVTAFREPKPSRILESIVYWHLQRQGLHTSYALVGAGKREIDFIAGLPDAPPHAAIQVCTDLSDPEVMARETQALDRLVEQHTHGIEPLILTLHDPPRGLRSAYSIKKAWQWCLESS